MTKIAIKTIPGSPYRGEAAMLGDTELAAGTGAICCQAARVLLQMGHVGRVEFWRGDMLCLSGSIEAFAWRTVTEAGSPRFIPYRPFPIEGRPEVSGSAARALFPVTRAHDRHASDGTAHGAGTLVRRISGRSRSIERGPGGDKQKSKGPIFPAAAAVAFC
jgi:hypothetical protein